MLAAIHGARTNIVALDRDFGIPPLPVLRKSKAWDFHAALTFITTPNAPSGRGYPTAELEALCRAQKGVVVLDEAYVDFADANALKLALKYPHVLVARTFSKAYSLCFQRVGYFVGHPALIAALDKIRDSYNVNGLGQIGALATLDDLNYYRANFRKIISTRERLARELTALGFSVLPEPDQFHPRPSAALSRRKPGWKNCAPAKSSCAGSNIPPSAIISASPSAPMPKPTRCCAPSKRFCRPQKNKADISVRLILRICFRQAYAASATSRKPFRWRTRVG